jgi:acetyltransferase-like isoleucine patch superfamily enzyme
VGNRSLAERQEDAFRRAGRQVEDLADLAEIRETRFLLFADHLYLSWPLLKRFLRAVERESEGLAGCFQLALKESAFTKLTCFTAEQPHIELPGDGRAVLYRLYHVRLGPNESVLTALDRARPVVLEPWIKTVTLPFSSRIPTMSDLPLPVTDSVAIELSSWVHLWLANLCFIGVWLLGLLRTPQGLAWLAWRSLLGLLTALSLRPYRILATIAGKLVVRGRGCRVHPSAVVEASVLGRNVEIGPLCVVRGSILGDGVHVMEHSIVDGSVLGEKVIINQQGMIKASVAYPEAVFNFMQAGLVGRRVFLGWLFRPMDMKLQGTIRVRHHGRLVDTGLPFLGCCIGHRAMISGESRLMPGRTIPNDCKILSDYTEAMDKVPDDVPTDRFLLERRGRLEPLNPVQRASDESPRPETEGPLAPDGGSGPRTSEAEVLRPQGPGH